MNTLNIVKSSIIAIGLITMVSCVDLDPKPLSFYAPENTYNTKEGLEAGLNTCRKQIKWEWFGDAFSNMNPLVSEYAYSDMSVMGSPETKEIHNLEIQLTPESSIDAYLRYWEYCWNGIKYANTIVTRVETVEGISEQDKNALLSEAYFHRSYWYYLLTHQWGDVPLVLEEVAEPKIDFVSSSRLKILHQMKSDMEFAVQWLPKEVVRGGVNRAAGEHLLTKLYLAVGEFQKAVDSATRCINDNGLSLMKTRFGTNASNASLDVFNDLFGEVNISDNANKEAIFVLQERYGLLGNVQGNGSQRMRNYVPYWSNGAAVRTPDGKQGTTYDTGPYDGYEQLAELGRGISKIRPSNYHQYEIWKNCGSDMRRNNNNWYDISTLKYNRPASKGGSAEWFGKPVQRQYVTDTMRCYYSFPRVKVLIYKDDINKGKTPSGGFTDQYVFRLAETYLMRAEAYYWLNNISKATSDVNEVRDRAKAPKLSAVTLDDILDERARELFIEEHRKTELTRIAFIMAQLGKDGYNLKDFSKKNWYYDRVILKNNFYRKEYFYSTNPFVIRPYHVLWPVPHTAITANTMGRINQNIGYPGAENNIPVE
ncbi:RagB/SusD family nutrient uptake outer membrane protein [Prevotella sp. 10(H)]|uniref:RagB/SusD family nutrient uptake outer membrane protein n=1 Tax=Prevotella sp. 10(H) TaxID=1158294 RepID=UPI0004A6DE0A|nr:RagB/SusD family nutrient uptake outer membrane protein [Prevotella sp. 10(H)]